MREGMLGICALCIIGALVEQLHLNGRFYANLKLVFALEMLLTLACIWDKMI